jgi:hypothetical protein
MMLLRAASNSQYEIILRTADGKESTANHRRPSKNQIWAHAKVENINHKNRKIAVADAKRAIVLVHL